MPSTLKGYLLVGSVFCDYFYGVYMKCLCGRDHWVRMRLVGSRLYIRSTLKILVFFRIHRTGSTYESIGDAAGMRVDTVRLYFQICIRDMNLFYEDYFINRRSNADYGDHCW